MFLIFSINYKTVTNENPQFESVCIDVYTPKYFFKALHMHPYLRLLEIYWKPTFRYTS